jgi:E3 ubiquitin-protein ligase synoviolin
MFYGLPIHIVRDLFLTARSFTKRLAAFLRYRRATQDMNTKYEDATVEDIEREDTCIICREEMRPWSVTNPQEPLEAPGAPPAGRTPSSLNERSRPKKLPCGHILHLGCLKSWLERQQVCPTCRASVVDTPQSQATRGAANNANPVAQGAQPQAPGQQDAPGGPPPPAVNPRGVGRGMRMINFGPLRVGFGQANLQDLAQGIGAQQPNQENAVAGAPRVYGLELGFPRRVQPQPQAQDGAALTPTSTSLQENLQQIEQQIVAEIRNLQITQQELQLVQLLQVELGRLRQLQNAGSDSQAPQVVPFGTRVAPLPVTVPQIPQQPQMQRHGARANTAAIPSGSNDLPPGVVIPEGWSLLPLQRLDGAGISHTTQTVQVPFTGPAGNPTLAPTATTQPDTISPMSGASNNNLTPTPTINPENHSQAPSADSSNTNAISTSPPVAADQSSPSNVASSTTLPSTTLNNNPASIASTNATPNPSMLPNWGSSQLFSGPTLTSGNTSGISSSASTMPMPPPPNSTQGRHVDNAANADAHVSPPTSFSQSPHNSGNSASSEMQTLTSSGGKGKGKATAATVEDTVDEDLAEGS